MVQSFTRTRPEVMPASWRLVSLVKILGDVFGRGVDGGERLKIIEHLVVDAVNNGSQHVLHELEVEEQAGFVELGAGQSDANLVVMAVRVLALASVIAEIVAGGEIRLHGNFKHGCSLDSAGTIPLALF